MACGHDIAPRGCTRPRRGLFASLTARPARIIANAIIIDVYKRQVILLSKKAIRPIAVNLEKQKQFITDAGHEIKTPLAIILANTDAMELHSGVSKWSQNIRAQTCLLYTSRCV